MHFSWTGTQINLTKLYLPQRKKRCIPEMHHLDWSKAGKFLLVFWGDICAESSLLLGQLCICMHVFQCCCFEVSFALKFIIWFKVLILDSKLELSEELGINSLHDCLEDYTKLQVHVCSLHQPAANLGQHTTAASWHLMAQVLTREKRTVWTKPNCRLWRWVMIKWNLSRELPESWVSL